MNTGRFEERLLQELKARIEHPPLHSDAPEDTGVAESVVLGPAERRVRGRGRAVQVGLAAGVAVAMVATAFVIGQNGPDGSGDAVAGSRADGGGSQSRIVNAAYTVERKKTGIVKLTIEDPSGKPDIEGMRKDLESMGVRARVYVGDPACPSPRPPTHPSGDPDATEEPTTEPTGGPTGEPTTEPTGEPSGEPTGDVTVKPTAPASEGKRFDMWGDGKSYWIGKQNGKLVALVMPDRIPKGTTLTFGFPLAKTDPEHGLSIWQVGLAPGDGPDCLPALPPGAVVHNP
ncbi:PT domain-containing protein [Streptomyces sp. NPDC047108]|uniref:PT domain-containing protein n=1 Tax=Streptomyces sp. NPDC047108 TaxID=3155025 RepID=UPI003409D4AC